MDRETQRRIFEEMRRQAAQRQAQAEEVQRQAEEARHFAQMRQEAIDSEKHRRKIIVIAAVDAHGGFAKDRTTPWKFKEDLKWFKNRTKDGICVMGRNTYNEINARKMKGFEQSVLPGRDCFVVSNTLTSLPNATVVKGIAEVELHLPNNDERTLFVIGGQRLFREAIALAKQVYLTVINKEYDCDMFFPTQYVEEHFGLTQTMKSDKEPDLRFLVFIRSFSEPFYQDPYADESYDDNESVTITF